MAEGNNSGGNQGVLEPGVAVIRFAGTFPAPFSRGKLQFVRILCEFSALNSYDRSEQGPAGSLSQVA